MDLDRLFLIHYERLVRFSRRKARGLGDAEEFVHEAYLRSRRHWSAARRSQMCPESYLFRSLNWVIADTRRRLRATSSCVECATHAPAPDQLAVIRDSFENGLAPADRHLFSRLMTGRSNTRICQELRITPGALAVRIHRARRKLMRLLEAES